MPAEDTEDTNEYKVLVNDKGEYSLWLSKKEAPAGWREVGPVGSKAECLAYVDEHWDLTPKAVAARVRAAQGEDGS